MADKEKKVAEVEKPKKPAKVKKEKKASKVKEAWRGFKSEVKKVVWPSWKQVLKNTGIVLMVVFICAVIIAALDYSFGTGIAALTKLFG